MESVASARSKNHDTTDKEVIYDGAIAC